MRIILAIALIAMPWLPAQESHTVQQWIELANQGNSEAENMVGSFYETGDEVPQDYAQARSWYQRAADQGNASAAVNLGYIYYIGKGTPENYKEAARWFEEAAKGLEPKGMNALGLLYALGEGVPRDNIQAYMWLDLAISTPGDHRGEKEWIATRDALRLRMSSEEVAFAQRLARNWAENAPRSETRPTPVAAPVVPPQPQASHIQIAPPSQPQFHTRIEVFAAGSDQALASSAKKMIEHGLEKIEGVITVEKEPDYSVAINTEESGQMVAIAFITEEWIEPSVKNAIFSSSIARTSALPRIDHSGIKMGSSLENLCREIVSEIDANTLERERKFPRGSSDPDTALRNFLGRFGAKQVISKP